MFALIALQWREIRLPLWCLLAASTAIERRFLLAYFCGSPCSVENPKNELSKFSLHFNSVTFYLCIARTAQRLRSCIGNEIAIDDAIAVFGSRLDHVPHNWNVVVGSDCNVNGAIG